MNKLNKLYLSLGLLLSIESVTYTYQEERVGSEIIEELEQAKTEQTLQEIDAELYDLFEKFFDEKDTMPFSKIVSKVVTILKVKRNLLEPSEQVKCDRIIKTFEENKNNTTFYIWAKILIDQDLLDLMSAETLTYINSISKNIKLRSLIYKLKNNNSHSFF